MATLPDNYEQIKRASDAAFEAYSQHVPYGEGGNETAVKAGREAWEKAMQEDYESTIADFQQGARLP